MSGIGGVGDTSSIARADTSHAKKAQSNSLNVSLNVSGNTPPTVSVASQLFFPMGGRSGSVAATSLQLSGNTAGEFKFTGDLKFLDRKSPEKQTQLLKSALPDLLSSDVGASALNQVKEWLSKSITRSDSVNKSAAGAVLEMVRDNKEALKNLSSKGGEGMHAVGGFLTEALRCYNFAHHSAAVIKEFIGAFKDMNIPVLGNPDKCIGEASFDGLDYIPSQGVHMQLGI